MTHKKIKSYGKTIVRKNMSEEEYRLAQRNINLAREIQEPLKAIFEEPYPEVKEVLE